MPRLTELGNLILSGFYNDAAPPPDWKNARIQPPLPAENRVAHASTIGNWKTPFIQRLPKVPEQRRPPPLGHGTVK
jgi:hypothetical protein